MALPANGLPTRATGVVSLCLQVYGGLLYMYIPCVHTFYMYMYHLVGGGGCVGVGERVAAADVSEVYSCSEMAERDVTVPN